MAESGISRGQEPARVPRNHLPQPVPPSARSAETGTGAAPALPATDPPLAALQRSRALARPDRRCHFHPRTTCGSRRSCHSRSLGGDLLRGARNSHVATLVERHSRFCMLVKVPGKDTATVVAALSQHVRQLPAALRRSLTWDRGLEMAQHKSFTMATDVQVYFCDPQSPWQRGSNENTNGLLRQYLPKNADLSGYSQSDLDEIALRLNQRPRKTLGFQTPADRLQASVASTP